MRRGGLDGNLELLLKGIYTAQRSINLGSSQHITSLQTLRTIPTPSYQPLTFPNFTHNFLTMHSSNIVYAAFIASAAAAALPKVEQLSKR